MKIAVICVLFSICFTSTTAFNCYNCLFWDGHISTDPQCERNPSSSSTCDANNLTLNSLTAKAHYQSKEAMFATREIVSKQTNNVIAMCARHSGILDAKTIIVRACGRGSDSLAGLCITDGAYLTIDGRNATDVIGCFCTGDRCNSASSVHLTYLSLFAITIHIIHKFASA